MQHFDFFSGNGIGNSQSICKLRYFHRLACPHSSLLPVFGFKPGSTSAPQIVPFPFCTQRHRQIPAQIKPPRPPMHGHRPKRKCRASMSEHAHTSRSNSWYGLLGKALWMFSHVLSFFLFFFYFLSFSLCTHKQIKQLVWLARG